MVISNSTYSSQIKASQNFTVHTRPPTLFDTKNHPEHHSTLNHLSSANLSPQTCPNPLTSLLFHPRLSSATHHCFMVRTPKLWPSGSDGCSALYLWTHHLCLNHLPTSIPTATSCHGWLSPPSSTTAPPPSRLPSSCTSQEFLKPRYRLQFPEMYFQRMQRTKKIWSFSVKSDVFRPFISLLLLCN